ncbi:hypothetical protein NKH92_16290 [Mesorhizobium sp. M0871]|uniref:hypothetical protein n=1 Tax=Mesorhizobium sp. M0871 TaxID=2957017 RepID=UPI003336EFA6
MSRDVANIGAEIDEQTIGGKLFHKLMEVVFGLPHTPRGPVPSAIRVPAQHEFEIAFPQHNHARQISGAHQPGILSSPASTPTQLEFCQSRLATFSHHHNINAPPATVLNSTRGWSKQIKACEGLHNPGIGVRGCSCPLGLLGYLGCATARNPR